MASGAKSPLIVIVGETASGKSALAMELAERYGGELLCADSWTVYRGFDIGTAKPSVQDRARVRHHLLDVADPQKGFSAAVFKELASQAIDDITARGKLPIMVGGTGLYINSVVFDYSFLQRCNPAERAELNARSLDELIAIAAERNLDTTGIDLYNKRRVIRLIENDGVRPTRNSLRAGTAMLGLRLPPELRRERIAARVDAMIAAGLEAEVRKLAELYGWDSEPMKGIGYQEWCGYVEGDGQTLDETRQKIIQNTLGLAKRQRTWFTRNPHIEYIQNIDKAVDIVTTVLNK